MGKTNISWATHSWNPWSWACTKVSQGCKHCYAEALAKRYGKDFAGQPEWRANAWKELESFPPSAEIFCCDMSDVFLERVPLEWTERVLLEAPARRPDCTFLILTKRIERAVKWLNGLSFRLREWPNVWVGTSVEAHDVSDRIDWLKSVYPARGLFVSFEPLLGPVAPVDLFGIDGVIVGGESGPKRRHFERAWVRAIRDNCARDGAAFYYKQGSAFAPGKDRELDGRTWDALPWRKPVPAQTALF